MKNIVLTTDFSERARSAYSSTVSLAQDRGTTIHLVHELASAPFYTELTSKYPEEAYKELLTSKLEEESRLPIFEDCTITTHLLRGGDPGEALISFINETGPALVVVSTRGRSGVTRLLLGSYAEKVVRLSSVPVLTVRGVDVCEEPRPPRRVLVPFDFSDSAWAVVPLMEELHEQFSPSFELMNVVPAPDEFWYPRFSATEVRSDSPDESKRLRDKAAEQLERFREERLSALDVRVLVREGVPHDEIIAQARSNDCDLILMATHGWTGIDHFLLGSVTEKVVRKAPCSVLTVRPAAPSEA